MKQKMKRLTGLLLAVMMVLGTFTVTAASLDLEATGAGTHTIYYCYKGTVPDGYTVKANCKLGDDYWKSFTMTDTGSTHEGYKIYTAEVEEKYGGFDVLQFQQYDASGTWKSQEVAIDSWKTTSTFSGKMYYDGSWMDLTTDQPIVTEPTTEPVTTTTTIYLDTSAVSGWGDSAYYDVANTTSAWSDNRFHPNSGNNLSSYGSMTKVSDNLFMAEITYDPAVGMIGFSNANMHTYGDYYGNSAVVVKDYTGTDSLNNLVTLKSDTVSTSYTSYYDYELGTYVLQEETTSTQEDTQPSSEEDTQPSSEEYTQPSSEEDTQPSSEEDTQPSSEEDTQPSSQEETSVTEPTSATEETTTTTPVSSVITLYFTNNKNWSNVRAWIWNSDTNESESSSWPGKSCTKIGTNSQNQDIYSCTMDTSLYDSIIFASNSGVAQTADIKGITVENDGTGYYVSGGSSSGYEVSTYSVVTPAVKLNPTSVELMVSDDYTITPASSKGTLSYESSSTDVATVDENGVVTAVAQGTATITVTAKGTFEIATATLALNIVSNKRSVSVSAENGTVTGCPTEDVDYGTSVTLKAKADEGYTFEGYYVDDKKVSDSSTYTFVATSDVNIVANFTQLPSAELKVTVVSGTDLKVKLGANGEETTESTSYNNQNVRTGQYVTLTPTGKEGYDFLYWLDDSGKIVSYSQSYTFMFTGKTTLNAVYSQVNTGVVTFMSGYNQINSSMCYSSADEITLPTPYGKSGYTFKFWSMDGTTECTASDIYDSSLGKNVTVQAIYELEEVYCNLTVNGGTIVSVDEDTADAGKTTGSYKSINAIKVQANDAETGKKFAYWEDQNGKILAYSESYLLRLTSDTTITAVYVDDVDVVEAKAIAEISAISLDETTNKMKVVSVVTTPLDCTIIAAGLIATNDETIGASADSFTYENAAYKKVDNVESMGYQTYKYNWTKSKVMNGDIWYLRAYVTYKDANGNTYEVYGDVVTNESLFA